MNEFVLRQIMGAALPAVSEALRAAVMAASAEGEAAHNRAINVRRQVGAAPVHLVEIPVGARRPAITLQNTSPSATVYVKAGVPMTESVSAADHGMEIGPLSSRTFMPPVGYVVAVATADAGVAVSGGWREVGP